MVWSPERFKSFVIDTFPALEDQDGFDLLFSDSNKKLHLIPPEIDDPKKLKKYATGRSALYVRPKLPISLAESSSSSGVNVACSTTTSAGGSVQNHQEQSNASQTIASPPINSTPQPNVVIMTDEIYSVPIVS